MCVIGKDRLGWQYLIQLADNGRELMTRRNRIIAGAGEQGPEMAQALDNALYGVFSTVTIASLSFQKPAMMKKPNLEYRPLDHDPRDTWVPYPKRSDQLLAHTNCVMNSMFDLHVIFRDITKYFFAHDEKPSRSDIGVMVNSFHIRLQRWSQELPECISFGNASVPAIADMHMRYNASILTIFGFIRDADDYPHELVSRATNLRLSAARDISALSNLHGTKWPIQHAPLAIMQWATIALFTLLEDISSPES
ncbi:Transcription factor [Aspergillus sclerotialis]|uniref:Transcription factor n=1 Tax=Aspergillus sclerotialis TaxID=2070753 RepID=A0A3A2ZMS8_9EURO|nr:Transcription factor [Aspergillus sclerotialis]